MEVSVGVTTDEGVNQRERGSTGGQRGRSEEWVVSEVILE